MLNRKFPIMAAVYTKRKRVLSTLYADKNTYCHFHPGFSLLSVESVNVLVTDVNLTVLEMDMQHYEALFLGQAGTRGQSGTPKFKVGRLYLRSITCQQ